MNASSGLCGWSVSNNSCASVQLSSGSDLILQCSENGMLLVTVFSNYCSLFLVRHLLFLLSPFLFLRTLCVHSPESSSPADECVIHYSCPQCVAGTDCVWNSGTRRCLSVLEIDNTTLLTDVVNSTTNNCLTEAVAVCSVYKSCSTCSAHSVCEWDDELSCDTRDYDNG